MQRNSFDPQFNQALKNFKSAVSELGTKPFCIYGAGKHTLDMIECLDNDFLPNTSNFIGFISQSPVEASFPFPVYTLSQALSFYPSAIILGTDTWQENMCLDLKTQGFCGKVINLYPKILPIEECVNRQVLILENTDLCQIDFTHISTLAQKTSGNVNSKKLAEQFIPKVQKQIEPLLKAGIENLFYKGINLFELAKGSISCALNTTNQHKLLCEKSVCEYFIIQTAAIFETFSHIFSHHNTCVETVIYPNGFWHHTQAVRAAAEKYGIKTLAVELSFFPGLVYVEPFTGKVANDTALSLNSYEYLQNRTLNGKQQASVSEFFAKRCPEQEIRPDGFGQPPAVTPEKIRTDLGLPQKARITLALMQVVTDTTVIYDNPLYEDNIEFINDLCAWFAKHPEEFLIIKPHPKELKGISPVGTKTYNNKTWKKLSKRLETAPDNIILLRADDYNVYSLFETASIGITINSQAGFEMSAQTGKKVIVLGKAAYANKGFSVDVKSRNDIPKALQTAFENSGKLNTYQTQRLGIFAWHMLFEYLYPLPIQAHPQKQTRLVQLLKNKNIPAPAKYFSCQ